MTKRGSLTFVSILVALLLAPTASGHGAPDARDLDHRAVADNTSYGDYGGEGGVPPPLIADALDLLALDVREAYGPSAGGATAGLWLRLIVQTDSEEATHRVVIDLAAGSGGATVELTTSDLTTWNAAGADAVLPGVPVGDGHPRAVDVFLSYATLGAGPGDALSEVSATSYSGDTAGDVMPGGYNTVLGPVDLAVDDSTVSAYPLSGPAALLSLSAPTAPIALERGAVTEIPFDLASNTQEAQFVELTVQAPAGVSATLDRRSVALDGPTQIVLTLDPASAAAGGSITVRATSDLGALATWQTNVTVPAATTTTTSTTQPPDPAEEESPSPVWIVALALMAALLVRRRLA